jgi:hypothetical protein
MTRNPLKRFGCHRVPIARYNPSSATQRLATEPSWRVRLGMNFA